MTSTKEDDILAINMPPLSLSNLPIESLNNSRYVMPHSPSSFQVHSMSRLEYWYHREQQHLPTYLFKAIQNPMPAILLAFFIMVLVVICPLFDITTTISVRSLTYLLVYIPVVGIFCFAVFFSLTYSFLNLPRIPINLPRTLFLFLVVWILFQVVFHLCTMVVGIFPFPFQWIIISFGAGVPLIYIIVWLSIPPHIRQHTLNSLTSLEYVRESIPIAMREFPTAASLSDDTKPKPAILRTASLPATTQLRNILPPTPPASMPLPSSLPLPTIEATPISQSLNGTSSIRCAISPSLLSPSSPVAAPVHDELESSSQTSLSSNAGSFESFDSVEASNHVSAQETAPKASEKKEPSFLFQFYIVATTMFLGPFGYVFFHLFLFAFYSTKNNLYQFLLIVAFQALVFTYKIIFRLSFHRMRNHLPHIPLRGFQDTRVLFLFWLELSTHCFFSMVFPHVGSWYMILLYLVIEAFTLTAQILVDTTKFRQAAISLFEGAYLNTTGTKYSGEWLYRVLGQSGELDRTVSLELFFFNCVARILSGLAYIIFTLVIYFGPNNDFYPTFNILNSTNYFLTLVYAIASVVSSLVQMLISKQILTRVYHLNLLDQGVAIWRRKPDVAFLFMTNCFILPLVVLLQHNNAVGDFMVRIALSRDQDQVLVFFMIVH
eukprot:gene234-284_t